MINQRQFILSCNTIKETSERNGWEKLILSNGYRLSWQQDLKVVFNKEKNVCLIGHAWSVLPDTRSPETIVSECNLSIQDEKEILKAESSWCGRYVLIIKNHLYLDALGSLGVFYSDNYVSSSMNLMFKLLGEKITYPKVKHGLAPDYIPGKYTECLGVKRLLCNEVLNFVDGKLSLRSILPDGNLPKLDIEKRSELFSECLVTSIKNVAKEFPEHEIWITLTGGRDSRVNLAALETSGIKYKICTLETKNISEGDRHIPQIIAERLGIEYKFVVRDKKNFSQKRLASFLEHSAGMNVDEDRLSYAYGQYDNISDNPIVLLKGNGYEAVSEYFLKQQPTSFNSLCKRWAFIEVNKNYRESLKQWFKEAESDSLNSWMGIVNQFYFGNRSSCWLSGIEQSMDILENLVLIQPVNSRLLLSLLIGFDYELRCNKKHEEMLATKICPALSGIPYDDAYPIKKTKLQKLYRIVRNKSSFMLWIWHNYGIINTVKFTFIQVSKRFL